MYDEGDSLQYQNRREKARQLLSEKTQKLLMDEILRNPNIQGKIESDIEKGKSLDLQYRQELVNNYLENQFNFDYRQDQHNRNSNSREHQSYKCQSKPQSSLFKSSTQNESFDYDNPPCQEKLHIVPVQRESNPYQSI